MRVGKSQILMGVIQLLSAEKRKSALILKTCETIENPTILEFIMKKLLMLVTSVASILMALPAAAQFAKPEDAVKYRKASFTVMAAHFSRVGAMAAGRAPYDAKAAAEKARLEAIKKQKKKSKSHRLEVNLLILHLHSLNVTQIIEINIINVGIKKNSMGLVMGFASTVKNARIIVVDSAKIS